MVIMLLKQFGIPSIAVIRNEAQIQGLKDIGANFVLNQESLNFKKEIKDLA